ncbi:hypothetical protein ACI3DN_02510 [Sellimonas catena]|uniref:HNH endonuclease n=1 Tax=Sellimonas catena TaxID=2994035 RepID=A0A9W6C6A1_9FIRM|nr:hypothetical protein [Sellimonas catena]GLG03958.1 hypothetical protein Selli1_11320 [Sellimonas catena]
MRDKEVGFFLNNDDSNYIGDERIRPYLSYNRKKESYCIYCSNLADSREHLPPRIFVDTPNLNEWNIVPACKSCNNGYSQEEQMVACMIEYIIALIYYKGEIQREKIKHTFEKRPKILEKIKTLCVVENDLVQIDSAVIDMIKRVMLKIAKGHFMYECNVFLPDDADVLIDFEPLMDKKKLDEFNSPIACNYFPEIGSRESDQLCIMMGENQVLYSWKVIDNDNYRYAISPNILRIVIREFLYVEIIHK